MNSAKAKLFKFIEHLKKGEVMNHQVINDADKLMELSFSKISIDSLNEKIKLFDATSDDLGIKELINLLYIELPGGFRASSLLLRSDTFEKGSHFFRVRKLTDDIVEQINKGEIDESELWEPPLEYVKQGRVNEEKKQYLYISDSDLDICVAETKLQEGDYFLLISYENLSNINTLGIGFDPLPNFLILSPETKKKLVILTEAINKTFLSNSDTAYKYSNYIAKHLDFEEKDGWSYPSVQFVDDDKKNICLRLSVKDKLKIDSLLVCSYHTDKKEKYRFHCAIEVINGKQKRYIYDPSLNNENNENFKRVVTNTFPGKDDENSFSRTEIENPENILKVRLRQE